MEHTCKSMSDCSKNSPSRKQIILSGQANMSKALVRILVGNNSEYMNVNY